MTSKTTTKPTCPRCRAERHLVGGDDASAHTLGRGCDLVTRLPEAGANADDASGEAS
jgi:hypothetical protein